MKYAIRAYYIYYNDEWNVMIHDNSANDAFDGSGGLHAIFDTREAAENYWRHLECKKVSSATTAEVRAFHSRMCELSPANFDANLADELDAFLLKNDDLWQSFGESAQDLLECNQTNYEAWCAEDPIFAVLARAGLLYFHVLELPEANDGLPIYVRWLPYANCYHTGHRTMGATQLFCASTPEEIISRFWKDMEWSHTWEQDKDRWSLRGSFEELSETPHLLESVVRTKPGLEYDSVSRELRVGPVHEDSVAALFPLLKSPPFEIRKISVDEFNRLQLAFNEDWRGA